MSTVSRSVTSYIGRTVDLVFLHGDAVNGEQLMQQALVPDETSGFVCTGLKKLTQRYFLEVFTERGSLTFLPDRGTRFMTLARAGLLRTQVDVFQAFSQAESLARRNLRNEESDDEPEDERYGSSELLAVGFANGFIALTIQITSLAGAGGVFIFPVPIAVIR